MNGFLFQPAGAASASARLFLVALGFALASGTSILAGPSTETPFSDIASNTAKNLARMNCGARLECVTVPADAKAGGSAAALIMDDSTVSCPLPEGETTFLISLPQTATLDRFTFVNENASAQGQLKIAVSNYQLPADSARWTAVDGAVGFSRKRLFNLSLLGVEAKYVKLTFQVEKAGRIAALGLYGEKGLDAFASARRSVTHVSNTKPSGRAEDVLNYNFANLYARSRVIYTSSGRRELARRMIDDDLGTAFQFAPSDPTPTVIVELAEAERLRRVSAIYRMEAGRLDVYLLDELRPNAGDLSGLQPIASVTDHTSQGKAGLDFEPRGARYVALRWTPAEREHSGSPFAIAELSAFGDVPLATIEQNEAPELFVSNVSSLIFAGEGGKDFSNSLGTIADPPVIAPVSP